MLNIIRNMGILVSFLATSTQSIAHELWIDTPNFTPNVSQSIDIELRNGQNFNGINLSYFTNRVDQLYYDTGTRFDATSRMGDMPAMVIPPQSDGLIRVVYVSTPSMLTYAKWEKFVDFTTHKDAVWARDAHIAKGYPTEGFKEEYIRYSKALIGVGQAQGADKNVGLEIEIVAHANPYRDDLSAGLPVTLYYQGTARPDAQIEVFERDPDGIARSFMLRTDANGNAVIPVKSGQTYLLDSVVLRPLDFQVSTGSAPLWQSLWAALTFKVP